MVSKGPMCDRECKAGAYDARSSFDAPDDTHCRCTINDPLLGGPAGLSSREYPVADRIRLRLGLGAARFVAIGRLRADDRPGCPARRNRYCTCGARAETDTALYQNGVCRRRRTGAATPQMAAA